MAEDNPNDKSNQLEERLNYLESVTRDIVARLYAIERNLGIARHVSAAPPKPAADVEREARLAGIRDHADDIERKVPTPPPVYQEEPAPRHAAQQTPPPSISQSDTTSSQATADKSGARHADAAMPQAPPAGAYAPPSKPPAFATLTSVSAGKKSRGDLEARI